MKNSLLWLLALLMITLVACEDDDSSTNENEDSGLQRAFTTEISGDLSSGGHWTLDGSPYYVSDSTLTIPAGQELIIDPGVDVFMAKWASIYVEGTLTAEGTLEAPIRIISATAEEDYGLWGSLVFRTDESEGWDADASVLRYCLIGYGAKFNNQDFELSAQIVCNNASPVIEHCLVYFAQYNGVLLTHNSLPTLRSNIIHQNDGSGVVFDTSHVGNHVLIDWHTGNNGEPFISHNNVSANSSLQFRMPIDTFQTRQFGEWTQVWINDSTVVDSFMVNNYLKFGSDQMGIDENGDPIYRLNENNDRIDQFNNSVVDAQFDDISADYQAYNSCSPCIEAGYDFIGDRRTDLAMVFYDAAPNELRKRFKDTSLDGGVYTVTCDAFSHEEVTLANLTIEFAGYYGLEFDQDLSVSNVQFVPTADRTILPAWKSVVVYTDSLEYDVSFDGCTFSGGSESSYTGSDYIENGGLLELRDGVSARVSNCTFSYANNHGISIEQAGAEVIVDGCTFEEIGYSAVLVKDEADLQMLNCYVHNIGAYGVMVYNTTQAVRIENNLFLNPGTYGIKLWANQSLGSQILNNTITGATSGGIKLNDNCAPAIRANVIVSCDNEGSSFASAIHGQEVGAPNDINDPVVDLNVFYDNGGTVDNYFPANWGRVTECNSYEVDPALTGTQYLPAGGTAFEFGEGCGTANVGWDPNNPVSPEEN